MPRSMKTREAARYLGVSVWVLLQVYKPQMKKGRDWWKDNTGDPTNRYRWRRKTIRPWKTAYETVLTQEPIATVTTIQSEELRDAV